jgi:hypothetical protein
VRWLIEVVDCRCWRIRFASLRVERKEPLKHGES